MYHKGFGYLFTNCENGVEGGHWVLKDKPNLATTNVTNFVVGHGEKIVFAEKCCARCNAAWRHWYELEQ